MNSAERPKRNDDDLDTPTLSFTTYPRPGPESAQVRVEIAGATHVGHVRKNNEDHYLAVKAQRSLTTLCTNLGEDDLKHSFDEIAYGLLIADGMGGMAAGELASRMALLKLVELVVNTPDWIMKFTQRRDETTVMQRITQRFRQVDDALRAQAQVDPTVAGMGTTLTVTVSLGSSLFVGHIGDSRAYILRDKVLHQLTKDHTLAQTLIDAGVNKPNDDSVRALNHILTAALGASQEGSDPQVIRFKLAHGDQILLCTDGLTEMVSADLIAGALNEASSSQAACDSLINLALGAGGLDNVTVVLAKYEFPQPTS